MKVKQFALLAVPACLLLNSVSGFAESCTPEELNQTNCKSNQTVQCVKQYAPAQGKFIYKWEFVNEFDQAFEAGPEMFGKTKGYTPKACSLQKHVVAEAGTSKTHHN